MKTEYQTGVIKFSSVETGHFSDLLQKRSDTGWTLLSTTRYFSKKHEEDCLLYVLERQVVDRMMDRL